MAKVIINMNFCCSGNEYIWRFLEVIWRFLWRFIFGGFYLEVFIHELIYFNFGREVKHFKIHTVDIASNFNKLKIILIRITS